MKLEIDYRISNIKTSLGYYIVTGINKDIQKAKAWCNEITIFNR